MKHQVTLKELARQLDLSISTVSKALNDSSEISDSTKEKVKELANIHQYVPNSYAQGLKSKKTKTIGVVVPQILSNFFSMALDGMEEKATELGYKIIICISKESIQKEKQAIEMLTRSQVDGIIISPSRETQALGKKEHLRYLNRIGTPVVMFDRLVDGIKADKISINDFLEAEMASLELYKSGCSKIAYFSGIANTSVNENRKKGYRKMIQDHGLEELVFEIDCENYPIKRLKELLQGKKFDGLLISDELTTILTARNILCAGYKIPEDISLIGFTNGKMGETFVPSLTTIDQKAKEQGELAIKTIIDRIEGLLSPELEEKVLKASIIHRESTKMKAISVY